MSKNQPTILIKEGEGEGSIAPSESSYDNASSIASSSKRSFFSSLFDKGSRRYSNNSTSVRKLSSVSLDTGKQKSDFLGRRFSSSKKGEQFYKTSGVGNHEDSFATVSEMFNKNNSNDSING